jgi:hypothetical protein
MQSMRLPWASLKNRCGYRILSRKSSRGSPWCDICFGFCIFTNHL